MLLLAGTMITAAPQLPAIVTGLAVLTFAFFATHSLVSYDSQSDNAMYAQYANKLTLVHKVSVLMGGITSASREVIRPIVDRSKTLYFYNQLYEGGVCDKNVFNTGPVPSQQPTPLIPYAAQHFGKRMYIVAADYNFGRISAGWVKKYAERAGAQIAGTDYVRLEDSLGFGPVINRLRTAKPDVVVSLLVGNNHLVFYRLFSSLGLNKNMKVISSTFGDGSEHIMLGPGEASRSRSPTSRSSERPSMRPSCATGMRRTAATTRT